MDEVNAVVNGCGRLQQFPELVDRQPRILNDPAHSKRLDWVMPWNRENAGPVAHHDVLPLADDAETRLFQRADGL